MLNVLNILFHHHHCCNFTESYDDALRECKCVRKCIIPRTKTWTRVNIENKWAVLVVKWSACLRSTPTIQVRIPLKPTVFSVKFLFEKKENKQKEAGFGPFF